jgi:cytochrome c553
VTSYSHATDLVGDAANGKSKAALCAACHGPAGLGNNGTNPDTGQVNTAIVYPSLAGQHASYTFARLKAYKSGDAKNAIMAPMAMGLSEQDMHDLAAYFGLLAVNDAAADPALVNEGAALYRLGDEEEKIPSCAGCHGPRGRGNPSAGIPALAGQHASYTQMQMEAFADGTRNGGVNGMMADVSKTMSKDDIKAVASYIQGLR